MQKFTASAGSMATAADRSSDASIAARPRKYVSCPDCSHGLIFVYRDGVGQQCVETWFVCAVCEGSGKVGAA